MSHSSDLATQAQSPGPYLISVLDWDLTIFPADRTRKHYYTYGRVLLQAGEREALHIDGIFRRYSGDGTTGEDNMAVLPADRGHDQTNRSVLLLINIFERTTICYACIDGFGVILNCYILLYELLVCCGSI